MKSPNSCAARGRTGGRLLLFAAVWLAVPALPAQDEPAGGGGQAKVMKYHESLLKRPAPGYLFDRFFNSWLDHGTLQELEEFLKGRAESHPDTPNRLLLAFFHVRQGNTVEAIRQFRAALEKDPGNAEAWYQKGAVEARTLNFETALHDLQKAAEASPREDTAVQISQLRGKLLVRSGKTAEALEVWKQLLAGRTNDEDLREDIVELQAAEGLLDAASASARQLVEMTRDPQKKILRLLRLGDLRQHAGQREEAADVYAGCLAEVGTGSWLEKEILGQIDKIYRADDDIEALEQRLRKLAAAEPRRISLRLALAELLTRNGAAEPALQVWRELLELTPGDQPIRMAYVDAVSVLAKPDEAISQVQALLRLQPDDTVLLGKLAQLLHGKGDKAGTKAALARLAAAGEKNEGATLRIASLHERYGLAEEALELLRNAAAAAPDQEGLQDALAATLYKAGRKDEARQLWETLAKSASGWQRLAGIARLATTHGEKALAFSILKGRAAEWQAEPLFLAELTAAALAVDKASEALPWVRQRVVVSPSSMDADRAIDDAVRFVRSAKEAGAAFRDDLLRTAAVPRDLALLAAIFDSEGDSRRADELLAKATAGEPLLGNLLEARLLAQRRQPERAAAALAKIFATPDGKKSANARQLATLLMDAGRVDEALKWIAEWKRLAPGASQPYLTEAGILEGEGKTKEALAVLRQAAQKFDKDTEVKARLAQVHRAAGQIADARRIYEQLYEDAPDHAQKMRWVQELAAAAQEEGRVDELVESFAERRRGNRTSVFPLLALAEIHRVTDNKEKRRDALLEAARLKSDDTDLLLEIARIESEQGDIERSLTTLRKAQPLDKSGRVAQLIAQTLLAAGKTSEGLQELQQLAATGSADGRAVEQMALSLLQSQGAGAAAEFLRPQCDRFPRDYRLRWLLAICLRQQDQPAAAFEQILAVWNVADELPATGIKFTGLSGMDTDETLRAARSSPPGTLEAFQMLQGLYHLSTQFGRLAQYARQYRSSGGPPLELPATLQEKDALCLGWLAQEAAEHPENRPRIEALLAERRLPQPAALLDLGKAMDDTVNDRSTGGFAELARAHPDNELLLAMAVCMSVNDYETADMELARLAHERLHQKYPAMGLVAALQCFREPNAAVAPLRAAAIRQIEGNLPDVESVLGALYGLLMPQEEGGGEIAESKDDPGYAADFKALRRAAAGLYARLPESSRNRELILELAAAIHRESGSFDELLDLLLAAETKAPGTTASRHGYSPSSDYGFDLPQFPPTALTTVPDAFTDLAENLEEDFARLDGDKEKEARILKWNTAVAAKVADPVRKAVLAAPTGDEAFLKGCVDAVAAMPVPTADGCLVLAGWAAKHEKWQEAAHWLRRGLFLPLSRPERQRFDQHLTAIAQQHRDALGEGDSPLLATARDAALRLRLSVVDRDLKNVLIEALEILGLKEAADAESDKIAGAGAGSSSRWHSGSGAASAASRSSLETRVKALLAKGGKADALNLLLKTAKAALTSAAGNAAMGGYYGRSEVLGEDFRTAVVAGKLVESLLGAAHPVSGSTPVSWEEYVAIFRCLNERSRDQLNDLMREAITRDPAAHRVRCRLAFELLKESPDEARELIGALPASQMQAISSGLNDRSFWQEPPVAERTLNFFRTLLEKHRDASDAQWVWVFQVLQLADDAFGRFSGNDRGVTTHLTAVCERQPELQPLTPAAASFLQAHAAFVRAAAAAKPLAPCVFELQAAHELAAGNPADQLLAQAREMTLHPVAEPKGARVRQDLRLQVTFVAAQASRINRLTRFSPVVLLVEDAARRNELSGLKAALAPELEKSGRRQELKLFQSYTGLFEVPEEQFIGTARTFLKLIRGQQVDSGEANAALLRAWKQRKLQLDLAPLVLDTLTPTAVAQSELSDLCLLWARELGQRKDRKAAKTFITAIVEKLLGPLEKRSEVVTRHYGSSTEIGRCLEELSEFFMALSGERQLSLLGAEILQEQLSPHHPDFNADQISQSDSLAIWLDLPDRAAKPDVLRDEIALTPFILDLPDFTPRLSRTGRPARFPLILSGLAALPPQARPAFAGIAPGDTFGGRLLHAAMSESGLSGVLAEIEKERPRIETLSAERQMDLRLFGEVLFAKPEDKARLSPPAAATLEWLKKLGGGQPVYDPRIATFLKTPATRSANFDADAVMARGIEIAADAVADNPAAAADVLRHTRKLLTANPVLDPDIDDPVTQLARGFFDELAPDNNDEEFVAAPVPVIVGTALQGLLEDDGYFVAAHEFELASLLHHWHVLHHGGDGKIVAEAWVAMAREAEGKITAADWPVLAGPLICVLADRSNYKKEHFQNAAAVLEKAAGEIAGAKHLALIMRLGESAGDEDRPPPAPESPDKLAAPQAWLHAAISDRQQPLCRRFAAATSACAALSIRIDVPLLTEGVAVFAEAAAAKKPRNDDDLTVVLDCLTEAPESDSLTKAAAVLLASLDVRKLLFRSAQDYSAEGATTVLRAVLRYAPAESRLQLLKAAVRGRLTEHRNLPLSWLVSALETSNLEAAGYLVAQSRGSWLKDGASSPKMLAAVPKFIETIVSVDERWVTEAHLTAVPPTDEKKDTAYQERMLQFARRLKAAEGLKPAARDVCLYLTAAPAAMTGPRRELKAEIDECLQRHPLEATLLSESNQSGDELFPDWLELWANRAVDLLTEQQDCDAWLARLEEIYSAMASVRKYPMPRLRQSTLRCVWWSVDAAAGGGTVNLPKVAEGLRKALRPGCIQELGADEFVFVLPLIHGIAGAMPALHEHLQSLPASDRKRFLKMMAAFRTNPAKDFWRSKVKGNEALRAAGIRGILTAPWLPPPNAAGRHFAPLIAANWATRDDIAGAGDELLAAHPESAAVAADVFINASACDRPELVLKARQHYNKAAKPDDAKLSRLYFSGVEAMALLQLGRVEEAATLIAGDLPVIEQEAAALTEGTLSAGAVGAMLAARGRLLALNGEKEKSLAWLGLGLKAMNHAAAKKDVHATKLKLEAVEKWLAEAKAEVKPELQTGFDPVRAAAEIGPVLNHLSKADREALLRK